MLDADTIRPETNWRARSMRRSDSWKPEKRMRRDPCRVDQKLFDSEGTYGEFGVIATLAVGTD